MKELSVIKSIVYKDVILKLLSLDGKILTGGPDNYEKKIYIENGSAVLGTISRYRDGKPSSASIPVELIELILYQGELTIDIVQRLDIENSDIPKLIDAFNLPYDSDSLELYMEVRD